jgi:hypothetical protein
MYNNIALFLGHFVGDYWLQSHTMAIKKSEEGKIGQMWCNIHCHIYSLCMAIFVILGGWRMDNPNNYGYIVLWSFVMVFLLSFATHYPIDRTAFAWTWMKWIRQSSFKDVDGYVVNYSDTSPDGWAGVPDVKLDKRQYFIAPIYIIIDNSMHIVLMWILLSILGK